MEIGSYPTKRGKRYHIKLSTGRTIRGLTISEVSEIWCGKLSREKANRCVDMSETLPECPHDGESGVFDKWVVLNDGRRYARYSCSKCETLFDITEEEYKKLRGLD